MTVTPTSEDFSKELAWQLFRAEKSGATHVEINSDELHRSVGGYPGPDHQLPTCCDVMQRARTARAVGGLLRAVVDALGELGDP